ncbi:MAG: hypothetical protein A2Z39_01785 [Deltaproteobacteria bacterium RBG_19FT_COMBO_46_9]|nr:MAG: hypothetical protein A2Z39_01785 [Deltaproteobacteria bacterium RBG_19FT_COMBO_46_9]
MTAGGIWITRRDSAKCGTGTQGNNGQSIGSQRQYLGKKGFLMHILFGYHTVFAPLRCWYCTFDHKDVSAFFPFSCLTQDLYGYFALTCHYIGMKAEV